MARHTVIDLSRTEHVRDVLSQTLGARLRLTSFIERALEDGNEIVLMIPADIAQPGRLDSEPNEGAELLDNLYDEVFLGVHQRWPGFASPEALDKIDRIRQTLGQEQKQLGVWTSNQFSVVLLGNARADTYWGLDEKYRGLFLWSEFYYDISGVDQRHPAFSKVRRPPAQDFRKVMREGMRNL